MYSLFLKERDYPISVYMSYMMQVKGFTRTDATALLTHAAVNLGLRKDATPPANNTIARWGRTADVPQWAIITSMYLTESLGKIPFTEREWAFWAYSATERGAKPSDYSGKWLEWFNKAEHYRNAFESRTEYRKKFQALSLPDIASKVFIFSKGNNLTSVNLPTLLFGLASDTVLNPIIDNALNEQRMFTDIERKQAVTISRECAKLDEEISLTVRELAEAGAITYRSIGNIEIT